MSLPLESLKLTSETKPPIDMITCIIMATIPWILFCFLMAFIEHDSKKLSALAYSAGIILLITVITFTFLYQKSYQYETLVKIEDISLHSDNADVTFKKDNKIYTATMPKDDAFIISRCNMIKAKRISSKKLEHPTLGAFESDIANNRCTLKGR